MFLQHIESSPQSVGSNLQHASLFECSRMSFAFPRLRFLKRMRGGLSTLTNEQMASSVRSRQHLLSNLSLSQIRQRFEDVRLDSPQLINIDCHQSLAIEASALIAEAALRVLNVHLYDVQLLAGLTMFSGQIAEMATGEGKTITAAIPAAMNALFGCGVHVITSNAYLAERDCKLLRPLFESLGLTVGCLTAKSSMEEKRNAYLCDVTYGPGYEFGFDYLRDQVRLRQKTNDRLGAAVIDVMRGTGWGREALQRPLAAAVVDEIDNVLIDDALSPLVLSDRPSQVVGAAGYAAARLAASRLIIHDDFDLNPMNGAVVLSHSGEQKIWEDARLIPLQGLMRPWRNYVEQALRAEMVFRRDVDYIVRDGKIALVDRTTGRIFADRTWRDGLHQAIEAKENLEITEEITEAAKITRQRFFRLYPRLCGMTGTARGSEAEFKEFYGLDVTQVPLRLPSRRTLLSPRFFRDEPSKWLAIGRDVEQRQRTGQPVLVGTRSIAKSEHAAEVLRSMGIDAQVLNGKQDLDEAAVIANSGQHGAVTIATNMAGRGTDIRPSSQSLKAGGLHVIVTEHHDVGRIDRQLIGRSARQGEVGSACLFVSAEDDLLARYGDKVAEKMRNTASNSGELSNAWEKEVRVVQSRAERDGYVQRRLLNLNEGRHERLLGKLSGESLD